MFKALLTACLTAILTVVLLVVFLQWKTPFKNKEVQAFREMLGGKLEVGKDAAKHMKDCLQQCLQEKQNKGEANQDNNQVGQKQSMMPEPNGEKKNIIIEPSTNMNAQNPAATIQSGKEPTTSQSP